MMGSDLGLNKIAGGYVEKDSRWAKREAQRAAGGCVSNPGAPHRLPSACWRRGLSRESRSLRISVCSLKMEPRGFAGRLGMGCERKEGIKAGTEVFGLNHGSCHSPRWGSLQEKLGVGRRIAKNVWDG